MNETIVEIKDLSQLFPPKTVALKKIDTNFPKGKMIGVVGPDGAGKTTLIRLIAALLLPSEGEVIVDGKNSVHDAEDIHDIIGYMPQKFGLYEELTVLQNLKLYAELRGVVEEQWPDKVKKLLEFSGLEPFQGREARALSGGMKQKLGLACALVKKPKLLLLDEPSVGVDPISRVELWKMVDLLIKEEVTIVWSTAYLDEAEKCDVVLLLNEGELLYFGKPNELTDRVKDRVFLVKKGEENRRKLLSALLRKKNIADGVIQGRNIRVVVRELPVDESFYTKTTPRFEDAFIDILGGGPGGESKLAESREPVPKKVEQVIVAEALTKKFGNFYATKDISFSVVRGEVFGLLGPNGAGKSTTFKMLCGLLKPTSGKALINGINLQKAPSEARAHIGYMAQKFSLYGNLTLLQNLEFFSGIYQLEGKKQKAIIDKMIELFDLKPYLNTSTDLLPLGFKQRLSLACATMHDPALLFLDEPTSGVDPITRREFWNHINGLVEKGVTVMVTTHFMDEAEYCDRVALIYQGKVINLNAPDVLKEQAQTKENPDPTLEQAFIKLIAEVDAR